MAIVRADMSMSLDGFITGPNPSKEHPLGVGGNRLHEWVYRLASWREQHGMEGGEQNRDAEIQEEMFAAMGAVIIGRTMFDQAEEPWGDEPPFHTPVFIVTHDPKETIEKKGGTSYIFVDGGIEKARDEALAAAGGKDVSIGGANIIQQFIKAGLLDELQIHMIPVVVGAGTRLFENMGTDQIEFEIDRVVDSETVTHLRYKFKKEKT